MVKVSFYNVNEIDDKQLGFAVISARYMGKWIFCRHKERETWEIPGGHREVGEDIIDTAKRELYEEAGACDYDIKPICVYSVDSDGDITYGLLCFAEIKTLEKLSPETEIGEIKLFNSMPRELTYPQIQPQLHRRIQDWLIMQSSPDELWDVYDENRNATGRHHRRGNPMQDGDYHIVVHVWLQNSKGEFLITKRSPNKGFPNMWECTGGSALAGEDSITAALREVKEETGLTVLAHNCERVISYRRKDNFADIWLVRQNFDINDVVYQPNETCDAKYASQNEILKMRDDGSFIAFSYLDELFKKAGR